MIPLAPCRAKGLERCPDDYKIELVSTPEPSFIDLPLVKKVKIFHCSPKIKKHDHKESELDLVEEQALVKTELSSDNDDIDRMKDEVERMKMRVWQVNDLLRLNTPECPDLDPCVDMGIELQGSQQPAILQLQRNNHKLRQQICDLQLSIGAADAIIKELQERLCEQLTESYRIQRQLDELDSFKRQMEREFALCAQRFGHLNREKYDWCAWHFVLNKKNTEATRDHGKFVTKLEHTERKHEAVQLLDRSKIRIARLHHYMAEVFEKLSSVVEVAQPMTSPEIITFLYRNEKLFGRDLE